VSEQVPPVSGGLHALTLYARFADEDDGSSAPPAHAAELFADGRPGSLTHYFDEMSGGRYRLTGTVWPRIVTAPWPASDYLRDPGSSRTQGRFRDFVRHILDDVDHELDFGRFDSDGPDGLPNSGDDDGYVDFLFVNTLTTPAGFIEGEATGVPALVVDDYVTNDDAAGGGAIRIRSDDHADGIGGALQRARDHSDAAGTMAHEFGHALRLPDLYDLDRDATGARESAGIGYWGLMGHGNRGWQDRGGPAPLSAWSLLRLGWIGEADGTLVLLAESQRGIVLRDVRAGGPVYRLPTRDPDVYYLISLRGPDNSYYDRHLPFPGLLIWRIDETAPTNRDETQRLVDLVAADGRFADAGYPDGRVPAPLDGGDNLDFWARNAAVRAAGNGNLGDETDLFDGVRFRDFSPTTNPASDLGIAVENITGVAGGLRADLVVDDNRWIGNLSADATWSDTVWLSGDVTVPRGRTLSVAPGTVVRAGTDVLGAGLDPQRTEVIVEGRLTVGSSRGGRVLFTSTSDSPAPGDWFGLRATSVGWLRLERADVAYARVAVGGSGLRNAPVLLEAAIRDVDSLAVGFDDTRAASLTLRSVTIDGSGGDGIAITGPVSAVLSGLDIQDVAGTGIRRRGGPIDLSNSRSAAVGRTHVVVDEATGRLSDLHLAGAPTGVHAIASQVDIVGNLFDGQAVSLRLQDGTGGVEGNRFTGTDTVAILDGPGLPSPFHLNTVQQASTLLVNRAADVLQASLNWWGGLDSTAIAARMSGPVEWSPPLAAAPQGSGSLAMAAPWPNPFREVVHLAYEVGVDDVFRATGGQIRLDVHALTGQRVRRLVRRPLTVGAFEAEWDGRTDGGDLVAAGLYLCELRVGARHLTRRVLRLP
jgi:M6 family metalloprotease-like protein